MIDIDINKKGVDVHRRKNLDAQQYFFVVLVAVLAFLLIAWILQLAWNGSMPAAFTGAKSIGYSTALLLLIVAMILFPRKW